MKNIFYTSLIIFICASTNFVQGQVKTNKDVSQNASADYTPFLDASSSSYWNGTSNNGKGLVFPRTDLTALTSILGPSRPGSTNAPTRYDGMIVYNTATGAPGIGATQTPNVTPGFYYYKNTTTNLQGGHWVKLGSGDGGTKYWTVDGNGNTVAVSRTDLASDNTFAVSGKNFIGTNDATNVTIATGHDADTAKRVARLTVGQINTVDVGGTNFDFVMEVYGKAHFTKGIVTSKSTYPDYVFDNYYTGTSDINKDYNFLSLNEVETFIKKNNHLPGVTKIDELAKQGDSYMVDTTETAMQTLEKVEELYIHVIEQQKEIKALKAEIAELKK